MGQLVTFISRGRTISGNFGFPHAGAPCVIMSHGLESSKDGNKWRLLAGRFYEAGIASLRFSYSGCGEGHEKSGGNFEDTTLSNRIEDFRAAVDFVQGAGVDKSRLGVIGSSFGGMVALASGDSRLGAMVIVATPCRPLMTIEELLSRYGSGEFFKLPSGRRLRQEILRDVRGYDIRQSVGSIGRPLLIIHGSDDEIVPVRDAYDLYESAKEPKRLEVIEGGNHSIDGPGHLERMLDLTLAWFRQYL
jgi:fermentation-respiration switch protein FrsA (DUF1100 family)